MISSPQPAHGSGASAKARDLLSPLPATLTVVVNCSFILMRRISFPGFYQPLAQLFFIHKAEAQHVAAFVDSGDALINRAHTVFCFVAVFGLGGDGAGAAAARRRCRRWRFPLSLCRQASCRPQRQGRPQHVRPLFQRLRRTFWPLPRRSPMTTVICSMFCSLQVIFRDFEVDGEQRGLFIRQVAELCDHFAGQHH